MADDVGKCPCLAGETARRTVLKAALGIGVGLAVGEVALAQQTDPKKQRAAKGDVLVYASGDKKGQPIAPADLAVGGPQVLAWAMDPKTQTVRDGSRLNKILAIKLDPGQLAPDTAEFAADGVLAYSAVCTHAGCDVSAWKADEQVLFCGCHQSKFDPKNKAKVTGGPASRPLAILPLAAGEGVIMVAGEFQGRIGFKS